MALHRVSTDLPKRVSEDNEVSGEVESGAERATGARELLASGTRFASYTVVELIGQGGMARIYRAEDERLRREVALKVLTRGTVPGVEGLARFLQEARIAASIKHPNVVNIFDVGVNDEIPYLVMELLTGEDLDARLRREGALPERTLIDLVLPVLAGMCAVHEAGVVHRDLKPANVFLSQVAFEEVQPKLLDFGISKPAKDDLRLTAAGRERLIGTPLYMAPEALLGAEMTSLSDQYSLGVILYECASGVNPYFSDNPKESTRRITRAEYRPISEQAIRPSRAFAKIVERAMHRDPMQRFPDLRTLGEALLPLAAQPTRNAWGTTFDPVVRQRAFGRKTIDTPAHPAPAQPAAARLPWALIAIAILGWSAAASISTWALVQAPAALRSALPNPVEAPAAVPPPGAPVGAPAALPPPVAPPGAANGATPAETASGGGGAVTEIRALHPDAPPSVAVAERREGPSHAVGATAGKPKGRPAASKARAAQRPTWAGVDAGAPRRTRPHEPEERGTNNAPILD